MRQQKPPAVTDDEDVNNIIKLLLAQFPGCAGLSVNETCTALRVKRDKVYELINKGEPGGIASSLLERRRLVDLVSIARLLARTRVKPKPRVKRVRHATPAQTPKRKPRVRRERSEADALVPTP